MAHRVSTATAVLGASCVGWSDPQSASPCEVSSTDMCGIAGFASHSSVAAKGLEAMNDSLRHRGPDSTGTRIWTDHGVGLAHRRLSIIDLSPAGDNPMSNEDGSVWITFNGEIYNFRELRKDLERQGHTFRSKSDTEVVIHAYEQWGDDHVLRLRGMFAYAIYDRRPPDGRLFLVRDRLGIKPLSYYEADGSFVFASELKALLAWPGVDVTLDRSAIFDFLTYAYVPTPKTPYAKIRKLPPGHVLVHEHQATKIRQYWDVPVGRSKSVSNRADASSLVRSALEEAVRLHMVSDVPVGLFLSGGLDSSAVGALMAGESSEPIRSFSIGFDVPEHSETEYAALAARHLGTRHREKTVTAGTAKRILSDIVGIYDEPYADGSAVPTCELSAVAAEEVKVVLSGDGGDEVFGGYRRYNRWMRRRRYDKMRPAFRLLSLCMPKGARGSTRIANLASDPFQQYASELELFNPHQKRRLLPPEFSSAFKEYDDYWHYRCFWREELDPLTRVQYVDLKTYLPDDILTKVDRASMAVGLEVRPPLLDHVLVETVFGIPAEYRASVGNLKQLLKSAVSDLLPASIISRAKKGFSAPWDDWMEDEREWATSKLRMTKDSLGLNVDADPDSLSQGHRRWALLVLSEWANEYGITL